MSAGTRQCQRQCPRRRLHARKVIDSSPIQDWHLVIPELDLAVSQHWRDVGSCADNGLRSGFVRLVPPDASHLVLTHRPDLDLHICEAIPRRGDFGFLGLIGSRTKGGRPGDRDVAGRASPRRSRTEVRYVDAVRSGHIHS